METMIVGIALIIIGGITFMMINPKNDKIYNWIENKNEDLWYILFGASLGTIGSGFITIMVASLLYK